MGQTDERERQLHAGEAGELFLLDEIGDGEARPFDLDGRVQCHAALGEDCEVLGLVPLDADTAHRHESLILGGEHHLPLAPPSGVHPADRVDRVARRAADAHLRRDAEGDEAVHHLPRGVLGGVEGTSLVGGERLRDPALETVESLAGRGARGVPLGDAGPPQWLVGGRGRLGDRRGVGIRLAATGDDFPGRILGKMLDLIPGGEAGGGHRQTLAGRWHRELSGRLLQPLDLVWARRRRRRDQLLRLDRLRLAAEDIDDPLPHRGGFAGRRGNCCRVVRRQDDAAGHDRRAAPGENRGYTEPSVGPGGLAAGGWLG